MSLLGVEKVSTARKTANNYSGTSILSYMRLHIFVETVELFEEK